MGYQSTIPLATDKKNKSQSDIKDNFGAIKTAFETNHGAFNGALEGKHEHVNLPDQAAAPTTTVNETALYSKDNGGASNIYLRLESDGTEFNMTPDTTGHIATGYEVFPSGLIINWGTITINSGSTTGNLALGKSIATIYGFSFGARSANTNISTAKNVMLTAKAVAAGTLTLTRGGSDDTVYFDFIVIGK